MPADNETTEDVDDERDIDESGVRLDVRRVNYPEAVGRRRGEVAINKITGSVRQSVTDRGLPALAAPNALDTELLHQPFDRATSHPDTLTIELCPDLVCAIEAAILLIHTTNRDA